MAAIENTNARIEYLQRDMAHSIHEGVKKARAKLSADVKEEKEGSRTRRMLVDGGGGTSVYPTRQSVETEEGA